MIKQKQFHSMERPMKKILITIYAALLIVGLSPRHGAWAADYLAGPSEEVVDVSDELFTPEELDDLLAPIALYPDPLIAQILPAATFVDQIDEAARYLSMYGRYARIDDQPWDVSVKAVAHYPDVLNMMDQKYDWTVALGQAYINQPDDVMESIQYLREEARAQGNLVSNSQQTVIIEDGLIRIIPAQPQVIYVPVYDPAVVYVERPPTYGFITFGIGFSIGLWLNRDCDWHGHRIYYHGWKGGGWIGRARPHLPSRNSIYINKRYATVDVNRRVVQRNTVRYREDARRSVQQRRERIGQPPSRPRVTPPAWRAVPRGGQVRPAPGMTSPTKGASPGTRTPPATRTRPETGTQLPGVSEPTRGTTPPAVAPAPAPARRSPERPGSMDIYRGRDSKDNRTAPFGGYGSGKEIKTYRERGQESRESVKQKSRPAVERRSAPAQRNPSVKVNPSGQQPSASGGGRPSAPPVVRPAPRRERPEPGTRGNEQQR
jgi:Protein of unknown function (DUF3300)